MMLGLYDLDEGHARPMTAQVEDDSGPIWFFGAMDSEMARWIDGESRVIANFASKDHALFATLHGSLQIDNDPAVIDRLWNRFVAAWYEGGKDDPNLALFRLDPERAEIWENASSMLAGIKLILGVDPKSDYQDQVAEMPLS
jgi:general stress protein 26